MDIMSIICGNFVSFIFLQRVLISLSQRAINWITLKVKTLLPKVATAHISVLILWALATNYLGPPLLACIPGLSQNLGRDIPKSWESTFLSVSFWGLDSSFLVIMMVVLALSSFSSSQKTSGVFRILVPVCYGSYLPAG